MRLREVKQLSSATQPASGLGVSDVVFSPLLDPREWEAGRVALAWEGLLVSMWRPLMVARWLQLLQTLLY